MNKECSLSLSLTLWGLLYSHEKLFEYPFWVVFARDTDNNTNIITTVSVYIRSSSRCVALCPASFSTDALWCQPKKKKNPKVYRVLYSSGKLICARVVFKLIRILDDENVSTRFFILIFRFDFFPHQHETNSHIYWLMFFRYIDVSLALFIICLFFILFAHAVAFAESFWYF